MKYTIVNVARKHITRIWVSTLVIGLLGLGFGIEFNILPLAIIGGISALITIIIMFLPKNPPVEK